MECIKLMKADKIALGELFLFEGELMDVAVQKPDKYQVGDSVCCHCFGIQFDTVVLKKQENHLFLYVPLFCENFPNNRRRIPRVNVNLPALIIDYLSEKVYEYSPKINVNVIDLNIKGFGFISQEPLKLHTPHFLYLDLDQQTIKTKVILLHQKLFDEGYRYGCEIQSITKQDLHLLRRFVLVQQLTDTAPVVST